ncbi:aminotransferase class IV family protein [Ruegeria marina]|uniref:Probable branched-chain-amino-acid aminotransferase n=1 Tax=Ruegeria marina TaxID=639004 RepID=A0A1G6RRL1_9RHOB|nr:aminotransferase class IV family protein [Ruegeria marina]SDD07302.1 4-amino-4-deoxychorismate lyase [Ruegeria marina]
MEGPFCPPDEPEFRLIETFGYHPGEGIRHLDLHLARMARSAAALGLPYDAAAAARALTPIAGDTPRRCRLTLDSCGAFELSTVPLLPNPTLWRVAIHPERLDPDDPWLGHKTSRRALYDRARAELPAGIDEWLFLNTRGEICEGTITNVFVDMGRGLLTPPLSSGLLPGVLRQSLITENRATATPITLRNLAKARSLYIGNSLRGLIRVVMWDD